jgi:hypothetical protein
LSGTRGCWGRDSLGPLFSNPDIPEYRCGFIKDNGALPIEKSMVIKRGKIIPSQSIRSSLIAPCGMNCSLCRAYIREKRTCPGCYGDDDLKSKSCAQCRIKNCETRAAGTFTYCFECGEYPCARLKHLDKRYRTKYGMSMIDNLECIKQFGIRHFIKQEQARWACPQCGGLICVHKENCIFCGYQWH